MEVSKEPLALASPPSVSAMRRLSLKPHEKKVGHQVLNALRPGGRADVAPAHVERSTGLQALSRAACVARIFALQQHDAQLGQIASKAATPELPMPIEEARVEETEAEEELRHAILTHEMQVMDSELEHLRQASSWAQRRMRQMDAELAWLRKGASLKDRMEARRAGQEISLTVTLPQAQMLPAPVSDNGKLRASVAKSSSAEYPASFMPSAPSARGGARRRGGNARMAKAEATVAGSSVPSSSTDPLPMVADDAGSDAGSGVGFGVGVGVGVGVGSTEPLRTERTRTERTRSERLRALRDKESIAFDALESRRGGLSSRRRVTLAGGATAERRSHLFEYSCDRNADISEAPGRLRRACAKNAAAASPTASGGGGGLPLKQLGRSRWGLLRSFRPIGLKRDGLGSSTKALGAARAEGSTRNLKSCLTSTTSAGSRASLRCPAGSKADLLASPPTHLLPPQRVASPRSDGVSEAEPGLPEAEPGLPETEPGRPAARYRI